MPTSSQQSWAGPERQPAAAQPPGRPQLRRFLRTAAAGAVLFLTLMAALASNAATTWIDAWAGSMLVGAAAGLCAVWWNRVASRPRSRVRGFVSDTIALFLSAGFLASMLRRR